MVAAEEGDTLSGRGASGLGRDLMGRESAADARAAVRDGACSTTIGKRSPLRPSTTKSSRRGTPFVHEVHGDIGEPIVGPSP